MSGKVSICIPAYKRVNFLKRLLESIKIQTYKNYEVIITDDSPDNSVKELVNQYIEVFNIKYYSNNPALGTPKNWLEGISKASGEWIKIIHDDDWLSSQYSLEKFIKASEHNCRFIFSGYNAFYEETAIYKDKTISISQFLRVNDFPYTLFADNVIGPPSVLMFHHSVAEYYNPALKWLVDIEYYIRILQKEKAVYIPEPLINMSYNDSQVTKFCQGDPVVELPEALYIINNNSSSILNNVIVYDAWWRLVRNLNLKQEDLQHYRKDQSIPVFLKNIADHQKHIPTGLLKFGPLSKLTMLVSYLLNKKLFKG